MKNNFYLLAEAFKFVFNNLIKLIELIFRFLNALFNSSNSYLTNQKDHKPHNQESIELVGEPYEKEHYLLAQENEFEKTKPDLVLGSEYVFCID
ncbi:MAG: hypothetical protein KDI92_09720 [Xanthomonadales bacterium]|nr:hypothetical protein [Xanthomonadales bacterium]